jgi:gamma-tubulin complex component 5
VQPYAGEAAAVFSAAVFSRLDRFGAAPAPPAAADDDDGGGGGGGMEWAVWSDPSELSSALAEALAADESGELPEDPRDVSVDVVAVSSRSPGAPGTPRASSSGRGRGTRASPGGGAGDGDGEGGQLGEGTAQLEALSSLRLSLRIPWPLTLVIPESCLERYNAAAVFLLQVRRARAALEEVVKVGLYKLNPVDP